jgi:hypothetical protein
MKDIARTGVNVTPGRFLLYCDEVEFLIPGEVMKTKLFRWTLIVGYALVPTSRVVIQYGAAGCVIVRDWTYLISERRGIVSHSVTNLMSIMVR